MIDRDDNNFRFIFGSIKFDGMQNISANCVINVLLNQGYGYVKPLASMLRLLEPPEYPYVEKQVNGIFIT